MDSDRNSDARMVAISWGDVPPEKRPRAQAELIAWVEGVLLPGWPVQTESLVRHTCWGHHPDLVADLRALGAHWRHAAVPRVGNDGSIEPARVGELLDWVIALELAAARWTTSLKACDSKKCARQSEAEAEGAARRAKWAAESRAELAGASGAEWPVLGLQPEPWQLAAALARRVVGNSPSVEEGDLASMEAAGPPPVTQW